MSDFEVVVVGGGAAGICAAIAAARKGRSVVLCEKMPLIGKKLLATGNGRCNLLNETLDEEHFNPGSRQFIRKVFSRFRQSELASFFKDLGLYVSSEEGRIFPITHQAASVLKVLEMELARLKVAVELSFECTGISFSPQAVRISSRARQEITCRKVILAGGGKTYPSFGSNGSLLTIAESLGHSVVEPVPCAVPLVVKDNLCQALQGQRIAATASTLIRGKEGQPVSGDLLFARYGLTGTCILDVSEEVSLALNRRREKEVFLVVDMVPFLSRGQLNKELGLRLSRAWLPQEMLVGILPNKLSLAFKDLFSSPDLEPALTGLKRRLFRVSATKSWNEAEFTAGGVSLPEVEPGSLESKIRPGVYFAGELLDVNGARGGYNLAWAWASGLLAGQTL